MSKILIDREPIEPKIYLWLCCEGWQRFGPYEWLSFQDDHHSIVDQDGHLIAQLNDQFWRSTDPRFMGHQWERPTITTSPTHPHPSSGGHPRYRPSQEQ